MASLLGGRNQAPLSEHEIRRGANTFLGLDESAPFRYAPHEHTRFHVLPPENGSEETPEIVFSDDLYPGQNLANPNSCLSMRAAVAHEIAHFYRWRDKRELNEPSLMHLDEALTSLEAVLCFNRELSPLEVQQLVGDASERLRLHLLQLTEQAVHANAT